MLTEEMGAFFRDLPLRMSSLMAALTRVKRLPSERLCHLLMEAEVGLSFPDETLSFSPNITVHKLC